MIKLPKKYLSWSQINLVESSPMGYVEQYIDDKPFTGNVYTRFGNYIHENLEEGRRPYKLPDCPLYPETEKRMNVVLKRLKEDGEIEEVKVFGLFDGLDTTTFNHILGEYKTGSQLWSDNKAIKHGQLILYSLMHWYKTNKIPTCELVSIETEFADKEKTQLRLTGRMRIHKVRYTYPELMEMEQRVWRAVDKITGLMEIYG